MCSRSTSAGIDPEPISPQASRFRTLPRPVSHRLSIPFRLVLSGTVSRKVCIFCFSIPYIFFACPASCEAPGYHYFPSAATRTDSIVLLTVSRTSTPSPASIIIPSGGNEYEIRRTVHVETFLEHVVIAFRKVYILIFVFKNAENHFFISTGPLPSFGLK